MDTNEILRRVRRVEIRTHRLANDAMSGAYHSVFKGRGMDFEELREYVPGDDVRAIDRNVTARMGKPFVKLHREERDLTLMIVMDVSASFDFGSAENSKRDFAAEVAATLAFSAGSNNDKVGLLLYTGETELYVPPRKGRRHTLRLIREMLAHEPAGRATGTANALAHLNRILRRRAVVLLFTDFSHGPSDDALMRALRITNTRHDLMCFHIRDAREASVPVAGLITLEDAETGELVELDTRREAVRTAYASLAAEREQSVRDALRSAGIDLLALDTASDYAPSLRRFFDNRRRRV